MGNEGIRAKLTELLVELGDEQDQSPKYTVADAVELLLGSLSARPLRQSTKAMYRCWLGHGTRVLGDVPLRELSRAHGKHLLAVLADKPTTARQSCFLVSHAIDNAIEHGWTTFNPFLGMRKPTANKRNRTLSDETCDALEADLLAEEPFAVYAAVRWQIDTGWRCGEVLGLNREDLDLDRRVVHLRETKTGPRDAGISSDLAEWAATWMHAVGPVFRERGRRISYRRVSHALKRSSARLEISPVTTHVFRHTFISRALRSGKRREVVAGMVGHDDLGSVDRYTHVTDTDVADALESLSRKRTERPDE